MKKEKKKRSYRMTTRADRVARNERKIMAAVVSVWEESSYKDITLEKIADQAGVTVRTLLRKYGSKDGLLEACLEDSANNYELVRDQAPDNELLTHLKYLLLEYEGNGDKIIQTVAQASEFPIAKKLLEVGLAGHREWCIRVFGPYLPDPASDLYEPRLLAFITATEIHLWKLLRRDLKQSFDQTFSIFQMMLEGLIKQFQD